MDKRLAIALGAVAALVWYVWSVSGSPHKVSVDERTVTPSYNPFSQWATMRPGGYVHVFPDRIGPAALNAPLQNADTGALSTGLAAYAAEEYASA